MLYALVKASLLILWLCIHNAISPMILFQMFFDTFANPRDLVQTIILTPMNDNALSMNDSVLKILPGKSVSCLSIDKPVCDTEEEADNYPVEFLNSLTASGMPPHNLILKEGAIVMLLRNLDIKKGLCNGTCVLVVHLHTHVIDAETLTGNSRGSRVLIPRIKTRSFGYQSSVRVMPHTVPAQIGIFHDNQ